MKQEISRVITPRTTASSRWRGRRYYCSMLQDMSQLTTDIKHRPQKLTEELQQLHRRFSILSSFTQGLKAFLSSFFQSQAALGPIVGIVTKTHTPSPLCRKKELTKLSFCSLFFSIRLFESLKWSFMKAGVSSL